MIRTEGAPKKENRPFKFNFIGSYDIKNILKYIENFSSEWFIDTSRQDAKYLERRNPHLYTNTYVIQDYDLNWKFGDPFAPELKDKNAYDMVSDIIKELEEKFVGKAARVLLIKLNSKSDVSIHTDGGDYLSSVNRCHIPIVTNNLVTYTVDQESLHMKPGECWEINNFKPHSVNNNGDEDRIHLLIDILPEYCFKSLNSNSQIYVLENFLEEKDLEEILHYIKNNYSNLEKFPMTRGFYEFKRDRYEANIPETVTLQAHSEKIDFIKKYSQKVLNLFNDKFNENNLIISAFWMTVLGKDTKLPYHADNHENAEHLYRSAVIYLNDDFDGGYLKFKDYEFTYKPKRNSIIIFPSDYVHKITPVTSGFRYAIPMWASKDKKYDIFSNDSFIKSDPERYLKEKNYGV